MCTVIRHLHCHLYPIYLDTFLRQVYKPKFTIVRGKNSYRGKYFRCMRRPTVSEPVLLIALSWTRTWQRTSPVSRVLKWSLRPRVRALLVLWMCQLISSPLRRNAAFRSCQCISLSHCLHVCLCVSLLMHITETTCNSAKFSVHVVGLLLLWQLFSKLCTSGLVDKVKFSCNGLWRHDATAAALLLLQCRVHSDTTADAFYWLRTLLNDARR